MHSNLHPPGLLLWFCRAVLEQSVLVTASVHYATVMRNSNRLGYEIVENEYTARGNEKVQLLLL